MTNYERIKSMTCEEMAEFLDRFYMCDIEFDAGFCDLCKKEKCAGCILQWLNCTVKEEKSE